MKLRHEYYFYLLFIKANTYLSYNLRLAAIRIQEFVLGIFN